MPTERSLTMHYLPIVLREDNFPRINFRKVAINRNKKLYLFLNVVKGVFARFARKQEEIEAGTDKGTRATFGAIQ